MKANGTIHLAATSKQITQCQVRFDRVTVVFGQLEENLDCLVLLFIEQVIKATEIVRRKLADLRPRTPNPSPTRCPPATEKGRWNQQRKQQVKSVHAALVALRSTSLATRRPRRWRAVTPNQAVRPPSTQPSASITSNAAPLGICT